MPKIKSKKLLPAFTLIELLMVIAIVGILASVVLVKLSGGSDKAKISRAKSDLAQFSKVVAMAQQSTGRVLGGPITTGITGSYCSGCACWVGMAYYNADSCINNWNTALTRIGAAAGINLDNLRQDPWGNPYSLDENEMEGGACSFDTIKSCGPDGLCGPNAPYNVDDYSIRLTKAVCP